jgi:plastocyanin
MFTGWIDPNYKPAPGATPFPDCWADAFKTAAPSGSPAPSGSVAPSGSPAPSGSSAAVSIKALNIAFDPTAVEAPAGQAFTLTFDNQDAGIPHNVDIMDATGASVFKGEIVTGVAQKDYAVPALAAGDYKFICDVHPNMTGTLTVK